MLSLIQELFPKEIRNNEIKSEIDKYKEWKEKIK